jgi:hypothetical protein
MDNLENKKARPWDIFNKNIEKVMGPEQEKRFALCLQCPELIKATSQCKKCGCFMKAKVSLPHAECPLGKWGRIKISSKEEIGE